MNLYFPPEGTGISVKEEERYTKELSEMKGDIERFAKQYQTSYGQKM